MMNGWGCPLPAIENLDQLAPMRLTPEKARPSMYVRPVHAGGRRGFPLCQNLGTAGFACTGHVGGAHGCYITVRTAYDDQESDA
jgi:hypothetical protein